jgi:uncharacterized protein (TIGR00304 family)
VRRLRALAGLALAALRGLLAYGALQGDVAVHLVVVVPVVTGTGPWAAGGALLAVAGAAGWLWTGARSATRRAEPGYRPPDPPPDAAPEEPRQGEARARGGGVLLIGPIPVAWGSDRGSLVAVLVAATVLTLVAAAVAWHLA